MQQDAVFPSNTLKKGPKDERGRAVHSNSTMPAPSELTQVLMVYARRLLGILRQGPPWKEWLASHSWTLSDLVCEP